MNPVPDRHRREVEAFLAFVSNADSERAIKARAFHLLGEFTAADFGATSDVFLDVGATAGFAFLGRDGDDQHETITELYEAGHEIVLHGHRHVKFDSLSYETAHDDLSTGLSAIEDATSITPTGFFAPFGGVSEGTLRAAADLDIGWILGRTDVTVPDNLTLVHSVAPHDTRLLEAGRSASETFAELQPTGRENEVFLFHPNLLEYYGATEEFTHWVDRVRPSSISDALENGGPGVVLDCLRPIKTV